MTPKYQVFISATQKDLLEEREELIKSVLRKKHIPLGMEMFAAGNEETWKAIQRMIDGCDYYVLIIAHRYGSLNGKMSDDALSYTEMEYDYAVKQGVPVMALVISNDAPWSANKYDDDSDVELKKYKQEALKNFKTKALERLSALWHDKMELRAVFAESFDELVDLNPRDGWVPAKQAASPETANEIARLSAENAELREQLKAASSAPVLMPKLEVDFWIEWQTEKRRQVFENNKFTTKKMDSYVLIARLKNTGNLVCSRAQMEVALSDDADPISEYLLIDFYLESDSSILPGQSKFDDCLLNIQQVESPNLSLLRYSTHPDQGHATHGEIHLADIEIRVPRPIGAKETPLEP